MRLKKLAKPELRTDEIDKMKNENEEKEISPQISVLHFVGVF